MIAIQTPLPSPVAEATMLSKTKQICWLSALLLPLVLGPLWCLAWRSHDHYLGTLSGFVLLTTLVTCAITDIRGHKIYNWATYSAFLWALAINILPALVTTSGDVLNGEYQRVTAVDTSMLGTIGLLQCLAGAALCFLITFVGYDLSGGGAGDVKLAAVIGALLGLQHGVFAVAYSYIVAALAIIIWSIWANGPLALVKAAGRTLGSLLGSLWPFPVTETDTKLLTRPIPLGPYFAIGTLLVVLEIVPS